MSLRTTIHKINPKWTDYENNCKLWPYIVYDIILCHSELKLTLLSQNGLIMRIIVNYCRK